jgi:molecular chaperone GrpE
MTQDDKNRQEQQDVMEEMEQEIEEIENEEGGIDEEELEAAQGKTDPEEEKCKEILARTVADFDNFKKRVERDKQDMIFFLKQDIFKKILPRVDDIERIIKNTPVELQE